MSQRRFVVMLLLVIPVDLLMGLVALAHTKKLVHKCHRNYQRFYLVLGTQIANEEYLYTFFWRRASREKKRQRMLGMNKIAVTHSLIVSHLCRSVAAARGHYERKIVRLQDASKQEKGEEQQL